MNYREAYNFYACNGILFNHGVPRRSICDKKDYQGIGKYIPRTPECLFMGNLDAKRDWGHAKDYVKMQWLMLQQENPVDYVIASGSSHS